MKELILAIVCSTLPGLTAVVSAQEIGEDLCGDCHSTGKIDVQFSQKELDMEKDVVYCSFFMEAHGDTLGLDWQVCPKCRTPSAQARAQRDFDSEFSKRKKWLDGRREEVDAHARKEIHHIQTRHFVIAWDIPKVKVGRRILRAHEAMHLYAQRMEDLFKEVLDMHIIKERDLRSSVYRLYLFESQMTAQLVGNQVLGGFGVSSAKSLLGKDGTHVRWWKKDDLPKDEMFHQVLVHSVSHLIHNDVNESKKWLAVRYGWVYEGLAHYLEIRLFGPPITWCHRETGGFAHWKGKNWEGNVRKAVMAGKEPPFQEIITKASDVLSPMEHQFSWSYIDYLMWLDPHKMPRMLGFMKGPQLPTRDALKRAYGITVGQFVDGWKEFVLTEYSMRPGKGPRIRQPKGGE